MSEQVVVIGGAGRAVKPLADFATVATNETALTATATFVPVPGIQVLSLAHATVAIAATIAAPVAGNFLIIANRSASGTAAHTVTLTAGTVNITGNNKMTLNAPDETIILYGISATEYVIVSNIGAVALATV